MNKVSSEDSPLEAAKRGKDTSMWLAVESIKNKDCDIIISAGNTVGLLFIKTQSKNDRQYRQTCAISFMAK